MSLVASLAALKLAQQHFGAGRLEAAGFIDMQVFDLAVIDDHGKPLAPESQPFFGQVELKACGRVYYLFIQIPPLCGSAGPFT